MADQWRSFGGSAVDPMQTNGSNSIRMTHLQCTHSPAHASRTHCRRISDPYADPWRTRSGPIPTSGVIPVGYPWHTHSRPVPDLEHTRSMAIAYPWVAHSTHSIPMANPTQTRRIPRDTHRIPHTPRSTPVAYPSHISATYASRIFRRSVPQSHASIRKHNDIGWVC